MARQILATVVECKCPKCSKVLNIRAKTGESSHIIKCWNCDTTINFANGYGENNVRITSNGQRINFRIIWQENP